MEKPVPSRGILRFGVFEADLKSGELRKNGSKLRLQEQPFQVLALLLQNLGEVISREQLRQTLWPADTFVDFDHSLNTAINKIREALGDSANNPRFVETLSRRGYRFIAPVQPASDTLQGGGAAAAEAPTASFPAQAIEETEALPAAHRGVVRALLLLIQIMYLIFYGAALARLHVIDVIADQFLGGRGWILVAAVLLTAVIGIPLRLYMLTAVAFDYKPLGRKFKRLFPLLLPLDQLWALSPFLLTPQIGLGLAFAAVAALLYLPFSQRTLIRMSY